MLQLFYISPDRLILDKKQFAILKFFEVTPYLDKVGEILHCVYFWRATDDLAHHPLNFNGMDFGRIEAGE